MQRYHEFQPGSVLPHDEIRHACVRACPYCAPGARLMLNTTPYGSRM
jgi:hypothetical protein